MAFFTFSQNNPGGSFWLDHKLGIGGYVIVEAPDEEAAMDYCRNRLDMLFYGNECECCGSRWGGPCDEGAEPVIYGEPITDWVPSDIKADPEYGYSGYVHYADGRVVPFGGEVEP